MSLFSPTAPVQVNVQQTRNEVVFDTIRVASGGSMAFMVGFDSLDGHFFSGSVLVRDISAAGVPTGTERSLALPTAPPGFGFDEISATVLNNGQIVLAFQLEPADTSGPNPPAPQLMLATYSADGVMIGSPVTVVTPGYSASQPQIMAIAATADGGFEIGVNNEMDRNSVWFGAYNANLQLLSSAAPPIAYGGEGTIVRLPDGTNLTVRLEAGPSGFFVNVYKELGGLTETRLPFVIGSSSGAVSVYVDRVVAGVSASGDVYAAAQVGGYSFGMPGFSSGTSSERLVVFRVEASGTAELVCVVPSPASVVEVPELTPSDLLVLADGSFVVAYTCNVNLASTAVVQHFNANGTFNGDAVTMGSADGFSGFPHLNLLADGRIGVTFTRLDVNDSNGSDVQTVILQPTASGLLTDSLSTPTAPVEVNAVTTWDEFPGFVGRTATGDVIVAYASYDMATGEFQSPQIRLRTLDASGQPTGSEISLALPANFPPAGSESDLDVLTLSGGSIAVVYEATSFATGAIETRVQVYTSAGVAVGPLLSFSGNVNNSGTNVYAAAARADGGFDLVIGAGSTFTVQTYSAGASLLATAPVAPTTLPFGMVPFEILHDDDGNWCTLLRNFSGPAIALAFGNGNVVNVPLGGAPGSISGPNVVSLDLVSAEFTPTGTVMIALERYSMTGSVIDANMVQVIEVSRDGTARVVGEIEGPTGPENLNDMEATDIHVLADGSVLVALQINDNADIPQSRVVHMASDGSIIDQIELGYAGGFEGFGRIVQLSGNTFAVVYGALTGPADPTGADVVSQSFTVSGIVGLTINGTSAGESLAGTADGETVIGFGGNDTMNGNGGADYLVGGFGNDSLDGGAGDDTLDGGVGDDALNGGAGLDIVTYFAATGGVSINLATGGAIAVPGLGTDSLSGIEGVIGSRFADLLTGDANANELSGGAGNDTIAGGAGADVMDGGLGVDTLTYAGSGAGVTAMVAAHEFHGGDAEGDAAGGFEVLIGSQLADTLSGGDGILTVDGGNGDDLIIATYDSSAFSNTPETMSGGAGTDTLSYSEISMPYGLSAGVSVNLQTQTVTGFIAMFDTISGFENVIGSDWSDTLVGSIGANLLDGGAANDTLTGGDGDDTLIGGAGGDRLDGGNGIDTLSYVGSTAGVSVNIGSGGAGWADAAGDIVLGFENLTGGNGDDRLTGSAIANVIRGGVGADTINGGSGNDTLSGDDGNDLIIGGAGADLMSGGLGIDTLSYEGTSTGISVNLGSGGAGGGVAAGDVHSGFENLIGGNSADRLLGSTQANSIRGGAGNDTILGGSGHDLLLGEAGNDSISGGNDNDLIDGGAGSDNLDGGLGIDTIGYAGSLAAVSVNLGTGGVGGGDATGDVIANFENIIGSSSNDRLLGSTGANTIDGNFGNDTILGGSGNDTLWGSYGNDTLSGGNDADTLDGGAGVDTLTGGSGADSFVFAVGGEQDSVTDFSDNVDTILLDDALWGGAVLTVADVIGTYGAQVGANVTFAFAGGAMLTVLNTTTAVLLDDVTVF